MNADEAQMISDTESFVPMVTLWLSITILYLPLPFTAMKPQMNADERR
jgi:hypothetical protein